MSVSSGPSLSSEDSEDTDGSDSHAETIPKKYERYQKYLEEIGLTEKGWTSPKMKLGSLPSLEYTYRYTSSAPPKEKPAYAKQAKPQSKPRITLPNSDVLSKDDMATIALILGDDSSESSDEKSVEAGTPGPLPFTTRDANLSNESILSSDEDSLGFNSGGFGAVEEATTGVHNDGSMSSDGSIDPFGPYVEDSKETKEDGDDGSLGDFSSQASKDILGLYEGSDSKFNKTEFDSKRRNSSKELLMDDMNQGFHSLDSDDLLSFTGDVEEQLDPTEKKTTHDTQPGKSSEEPSHGISLWRQFARVPLLLTPLAGIGLSLYYFVFSESGEANE